MTGQDFVTTERDFQMNHSAFVFAVVAGTVSTSFGSIVNPTADPLGSTTYQTLMGSEATPLHGARWYSIDQGDAVFTYWRNQQLEFSTDLAEDDWRVGLTARNNGDLPDSYTKFSVDVYVNDSFMSTVQLPAQTDYQTTWFDIGEQSGETDLKLVWKNDYWVPNVYDANIVVGAVQFGRSVPAAPSVGLFAIVGLAAVRRRR